MTECTVISLCAYVSRIRALALLSVSASPCSLSLFPLPLPSSDFLPLVGYLDDLLVLAYVVMSAWRYWHSRQQAQNRNTMRL